MILGNQQPYLFPYIGYWQLVNLSDIYVISDSMQYVKKSYITRNYILIQDKQHKFSLEVLGVHLGDLINEVEVGNNAEKILKSIFYTYKKAPYFEKIYPILEQILLNDEKNLAKYIGYSIERIARYFDMNTKFIYESTLEVDISLEAEAGIIDICKKFNSDQYINAIGGQTLYSKENFLNEGIMLAFLKMEDITYKQFHNEFIPNLSIIDVMMFNSKDEIKKMFTKYVLL